MVTVESNPPAPDHIKQIVVGGALVVVLLLGGLGVRSWLGDGDNTADPNAGADPVEGTATAPDTAASPASAPATTADPATAALQTTVAPTAEPATTTSPDTTITPEQSSPISDLAASVASLVGVTGIADGNVAVLTGFVDNDGQLAEAAKSAADVDGIASVDNQLVVVQPGALEALRSAGVANAEAAVNGLIVFARGRISDEQVRQPALDAVAAVPGVAGVVDELVVGPPNVAEELNQLVELNPVQFATSSAEILEASFPTLDRAAEIILAADVEGLIGVHGYTDIRGDESTNLALSAARASAVADYLIDRGVPAGLLTSQGFGESIAFGEGDSPEALAANRRVHFVLNT